MASLWQSHGRQFGRRTAAGIQAGVLSFFLLLLAAAPTPGFCAAIRIMPLGDSITAGQDSGVINQDSWLSYRKALRDSLAGGGYDIDYVGSEVAGNAVFPDAQHEGHGGWVADGNPAISIRQNVAGFLAAADPHVVLLHIGTNDITLGDAAATVKSEVEAILNAIDAYSPNVWVVLALIINREESSPLRGTTTSYNDLLSTMAVSRIAGGDKLVWVDMETGAGLVYRTSPAGDLFDAVHPVASGYQKMAGVWLEGLGLILPRADAGPDQQANPGNSVTLDGTQSSDSLGAITSYAWTQTGGSPAVTITNPNSVTASFTAPDTGGPAVLSFRLAITDDQGFQHRDTCVVDVNAAPVADAGPDRQPSAGNTVTLDGSSSYDPDGTLVAYQWLQSGGSPVVAITNAASAVASITAPAVGAGGVNLTFRLTVTDNRGVSRSDTCSVHVNGPPVADAGPDQKVNPGGAVVLSGSDSYDSDGAVVSYAWVQTGGGTAVTIIDGNLAVAGFTAPSVAAGGADLTFRLTVTDDRGTVGSDTCVVHVNGPPTADAGPNQNVQPGGDAVLDGSGSSDPDDGIAAYVWIQTSGPTAALSNPTAARTGFRAPNGGPSGATLTFLLTVTDHGGLQSTSTSNVSVAADAPPSGGGSGGGGGGCFITTSAAGYDRAKAFSALKKLFDLVFPARPARRFD